MTPDAKRLLAYLGHHEFPVRRKEIAMELGWSIRKLQKSAESARLSGVPIGYSTSRTEGGVYLCRTPIEVRYMIDKIERMAKSLLIERAAVKKTLAKMETAGEKELFPKEAA